MVRARVSSVPEKVTSAPKLTSSLEGEHPDGRWSGVIVFASFMAQVSEIDIEGWPSMLLTG